MRGLCSRADTAKKNHWLTDERGAVFAEYVVVFLLATLLIGITVASVGLPLLGLFIYAETLIGLPIP